MCKFELLARSRLRTKNLTLNFFNKNFASQIELQSLQIPQKTEKNFSNKNIPVNWSIKLVQLVVCKAKGLTNLTIN